MKELEARLRGIQDLVSEWQHESAEEKLRSLIDSVGSEELHLWETDFRSLIEQFHKKRRRNLSGQIDRRLAGKAEKAGKAIASRSIDLQSIEREVKAELAQLSRSQIFQWSTAYRDFTNRFVEKFLGICASCPDEVPVFDLARTVFRDHSREIFTKGFRYQTEQQYVQPDVAEFKALGGLQRFLDLPLEPYTRRVSARAGAGSTQTLRELSSSILLGILEGFGEVSFSTSGWSLLSQKGRTWISSLAFLRAADLEALLGRLDASPFALALRAAVLPVLRVVDDLASESLADPPLPVLSEIVWDSRRLSLALHMAETAASELIHVYVYLDAERLSRAEFLAIPSSVALIVAPHKSDLLEFLGGSKVALRDRIIAVDTSGSTIKDSFDERLKRVLVRAYQKRRQSSDPKSPILYNVAREFPVSSTSPPSYFRVYRSSVRDLLHSFERSSGARLWCSVRRSGKTTACFDLASTTTQTTVVSQTCSLASKKRKQDHVFYRRFLEKIETGESLPIRFFRDVVDECVAALADDHERFVFVLDEYETLFGRLQVEVRRNSDLRYLVAQPLLEQMAEFASDNLLVLLGQQPDKHHILMDQNQLSPYLQQDAFPLFGNHEDESTSEFSELLNRILTERLDFDRTFSSAVHFETAGHPHLTVTLLISLVDWLIEKKRPAKDLILRREDFEEFSTRALSQYSLPLNQEFHFFRGAISEATSDDGRRNDPWLFAVYSTLRDLCLEAPQALRCTFVEFEEISRKNRIDALGFSPQDILRTGSRANFFLHRDDYVEPAVPLLGRLAASTLARASW